LTRTSLVVRSPQPEGGQRPIIKRVTKPIPPNSEASPA
jgi:hypothetical protein